MLHPFAHAVKMLNFLVRYTHLKVLYARCLQLPTPTPLTSFSEDEILFRDNIRQFAEEKVRPLVKEMDEKGVFDKDLIQQFFQLGLMGIEVPEQYGGAGGKFFEAILAGEELSRVDASAGVIVACRIRWSIMHCCAGRMMIRRNAICHAWLRTCVAPTH